MEQSSMEEGPSSGTEDDSSEEEGRQASQDGLLQDDSRKASKPPKPPRVYYVDWLRVVAIYMVVSYHTVQCLDWVDFYKKVNGAEQFVVDFRASALQIGMPMFFHISGRAHALAPAVGLRKTFVRRAQRLLVTFAVAYVILIPPWQYIDKEYDWDKPSVFHMKHNPIQWFMNYYTSYQFFLNFDMAWLWFLPVLFVIIVFSSPLFIIAERYHAEEHGLLWAKVWSITLWASLAAFVYCSGFTWNFAFFCVFGCASALLFAYWVPVPPAGTRPDQISRPMDMWVALHGYTLVQVAASIGLVLSFGYANIDPPPEGGTHDAHIGAHDPRAGIPFVILCMNFYVHGFFVQRWEAGSAAAEKGDNAPRWIWQYKLVSAFTVFLVISISSPRGEVESGHFIYPIYSNTYKEGAGFGAAHVLGTWAYIAVFVSLFQAYADHQGDAEFHRHATRSSLIVYIFHWIFIKVFCFWWLTPTLWRLRQTVTNAWVAIFVTVLAFLTCAGLSLVVYALLLRVPRCSKIFGL